MNYMSLNMNIDDTENLIRSLNSKASNTDKLIIKLSLNTNAGVTENLIICH